MTRVTNDVETARTQIFTNFGLIKHRIYLQKLILSFEKYIVHFQNMLERNFHVSERY